MSWKKLLETEELIAYEKSSQQFKVRLEARQNRGNWVVYKTYNFRQGTDWISHVREYVAKSREQTQELLSELKREGDISLQDVLQSKKFVMELNRCYKEEFLEKWKFRIDGIDNYAFVLYDNEIKLDIILYDVFNKIEKEVIDRLISSLGLKDVSNRIRYDIFYFKKYSSKRRVYHSKENKELVAKLEFSIDQN